MRDVTLVFLVKKTNKDIRHICLAMKKRGFGAGRWNGMGGKLLEGESLLGAAQRETKEEVGIDIKYFNKVAELVFRFDKKEDWNQKAHVYIVDEWTGTPEESEEMKPLWFDVAEIPYDSMWPDDICWLPLVLQGKYVEADFLFGDNDVVLEQRVEVL